MKDRSPAREPLSVSPRPTAPLVLRSGRGRFTPAVLRLLAEALGGILLLPFRLLLSLPTAPARRRRLREHIERHAQEDPPDTEPCPAARD